MPRKIPKEDYIEGVRLSRRNARRLLRYADEAMKKECYHAAFLLGFSSFEEIGKAIVILNHWSDDCISYDDYRAELINHKHKITLALRLINENILEVFNAAPRDYISLRDLDVEHRDKILDTRMESIYVDYDFKNKCWKKPIKRMDELASTVQMRAHEALSMFSNELKYRGLKIRY